jgi:hypothetical protein
MEHSWSRADATGGNGWQRHVACRGDLRRKTRSLRSWREELALSDLSNQILARESSHSPNPCVVRVRHSTSHHVESPEGREAGSIDAAATTKSRCHRATPRPFLVTRAFESRRVGAVAINSLGEFGSLTSEVARFHVSQGRARLLLPEGACWRTLVKPGGAGADVSGRPPAVDPPRREIELLAA